jgi:hypothetical protein
MIAATITFYWCVVFVHVMSVVIGFGATFVYPVLLGAARRRYPRALPYLLTTMDKLGKAVIGPSALLILASGIYLLADGPYEPDATFVQVAGPILIALIFLGPLYFGRTEAKLAVLAARDVEAASGEEVTLGDDLESGLRRLTTSIRLANLAVLVALFFMVVKP